MLVKEVVLWGHEFNHFYFVTTNLIESKRQLGETQNCA
jgi:hypothetical protein